ncbi:MAG: ribonuclease H-like domain-containing protein [Gloeobacteraceae cyanobacterium ES-bin-144]|nr:ribonuclease H-like domain-containing protein [Verrucomicrobiales bacterium]
MCLPDSEARRYEVRVCGKNIVYFDLETQRSFGDVGGGQHKDKMGVSIAVTYCTARGTYEIYQESEMEKLGEELVRADLVVGWNHVQFDYPVLQPYVFHTLAEQTINLDMMLELEKIVGFRLKLDSVASASLGTGKSADGLDALRWWQEHKKTGDFAPLRKIAEYCAYDVKVTKCVHEYALLHGLLKYDDKNKSGRTIDVPVNWK